MGDKSAIEWTEATWNPVTGCSPVSEGCRNCYAARESVRLAGHPHGRVRRAYAGLAEMRGTGPGRRAVFTGRVNLLHDRLDQPLRWKKPRRIFVNSMSDLFHPDVPLEFIADVWGVMAEARQHTFQVLTKRPSTMKLAVDAMESIGWDEWPLPNVWVGTSVEDQQAADERVPSLIRTMAAVRFLSCEPLLGPVNIGLMGTTPKEWGVGRRPVHDLLHWVIVGGESGPGARIMHQDWARALRDECYDADVAFHFKQWGEWGPMMGRVGKKAAGRLLDGEEWNEYPEDRHGT